MGVQDPDFRIEQGAEGLEIAVLGDWTVSTVGQLDARLRELSDHERPNIVDVRHLGEIDTAGAFLIDRALRTSCDDATPLKVRGRHAAASELIEQVRAARDECPEEPPGSMGGFELLERL
ncbi:MAG: ABC transporter permease, partial [Pseudomonadota bacterium]